MIQYARPGEPRAIFIRRGPGLLACVLDRRREERRKYRPHWRNKLHGNRRALWGPNCGGRRKGDR